MQLLSSQKYLLFGKNGWIGGKLIELMAAEGKEVRRSSSSSAFTTRDRHHIFLHTSIV